MPDQTERIKVAAMQLPFVEDMNDNIDRVSAMVVEAAKAGANVVLPPELFEGPYFCREEREHFFELAYPVEEHPAVLSMRKLACEHGIVIPVSFFEREGNHYYNSLAMIDASGAVLGVYRKSHIPDGPGYEEKYYFRPGNTGFRVWSTRYGKMGVGICWDQWFPECARAMALMGADILFYPTAIGSEPEEPDLDTSKMWQRVMQGHAVANVMPVVASNRIGNEHGQIFYGHSFIADHQGELVQSFQSLEEGILTHEFDLKKVRIARASMGFFRDRRPEFYQEIVRSV